MAVTTAERELTRLIAGTEGRLIVSPLPRPQPSVSQEENLLNSTGLHDLPHLPCDDI